MSRTIDIIARGMAKNGGGGSGEVSDIKVDGRSIVKPDGTAELATESPYDPETNPLATMNDVGGGSVDSLIEETTWSQLKAKRDAGELTPGMKYRITDYNCTTTEEGTLSANHPFDIIIQAMDEKTLSEDARAALHDGTTYFCTIDQVVASAEWISDDPQLSDIEYLYEIQHRGTPSEYITDEVDWLAEDATEILLMGARNNPSVMVPAIYLESDDEYFIFDGYYELYERVNTVVNALYTINEENEVVYNGFNGHNTDLFVKIDTNGNGTPVLYKTDSKNEELWEEGPDYADEYVYVGDFVLEGTTYNKWEKFEDDDPTGYWILTNVIVVNGQFTITQAELDAGIVSQTTRANRWVAYTDGSFDTLECIVTNDVVSATFAEKITNRLNEWKLKYCLDNDPDRFLWADTENGKGVIYLMIDEFNNEAPYDFKNIQYDRSHTYYDYDYAHGYTFLIYSDTNPNVDASLNNGVVSCKNNTIKPCYKLKQGYKKFSGLQTLNDIRIFVDGSSYSAMDNNFCDFNTHNVYINARSSNKVGVNSFNVFIKGGNNTIGRDCQAIQMDNSASDNIIGDSCSGITNTGANLNVVGVGCSTITFASTAGGNIIGDNCSRITLGQSAVHNTFGNNCQVIDLGRSSSENYFATGCTNITMGETCLYNNFGLGCKWITMGNNCQQNTFEDKCGFKNTYPITMGNTCSSNLFKTGSYDITLGYQCYRNTFGGRSTITLENDCYDNTILGSHITFGAACSGNNLARGTDQITLGYYSKNNIFGEGSNNISAGQQVSNCTFGTECQYISFLNAEGTSGSYIDNLHFSEKCCFLNISISPNGGKLQNMHFHKIQGTSSSDRLLIGPLARGTVDLIDYYWENDQLVAVQSHGGSSPSTHKGAFLPGTTISDITFSLTMVDRESEGETIYNKQSTTSAYHVTEMAYRDGYPSLFNPAPDGDTSYDQWYKYAGQVTVNGTTYDKWEDQFHQEGDESTTYYYLSNVVVDPNGDEPEEPADPMPDVRSQVQYLYYQDDPEEPTESWHYVCFPKSVMPLRYKNTAAGIDWIFDYNHSRVVNSSNVSQGWLYEEGGHICVEKELNNFSTSNSDYLEYIAVNGSESNSSAVRKLNAYTMMYGASQSDITIAVNKVKPACSVGGYILNDHPIDWTHRAGISAGANIGWFIKKIVFSCTYQNQDYSNCVIEYDEANNTYTLTGITLPGTIGPYIVVSDTYNSIDFPYSPVDNNDKVTNVVIIQAKLEGYAGTIINSPRS